MSKIVCDVCGTSYGETATHCPICGCVRAVAPKISYDEQEQPAYTPRPGYTPVRGGRFSKANVKKRNKARKAELSSDTEAPVSAVPEADDKKETDKGLLILFIVLLLSIVAVVCYILIRLFGSDGGDAESGRKPDSELIPATTVELVEDVPCQDIAVANGEITLSEAGAVAMIEATVSPVETTDELVFTSADESIATVDQDGQVTAVGPGQTVITLVCGDIEKTCTVNCNFVGEQSALVLSCTEVTLYTKGESYTLYEGDISMTEIVWKTSDEKVATVADGKVTAVSSGQCVISATYDGFTAECTVYCDTSVGAYVEPGTGNYKLNKTDVSIKVGESFTLRLTDENGNTVDAKFASENKNRCTVTSAGRVTGVATGKTNVTVTYEDQTFECIVRVR